MKTATKVIFTQMGVSKGINIFCKRDIVDIVKELKQLEYGHIPGKKVVEAIDPNMLSFEHKRM